MTAYPLQYLVLSVAVHGQGHYYLFYIFFYSGRKGFSDFIYIYIYIYIYIFAVYIYIYIYIVV